MQIHELNTFSGKPVETDYLAIDTGFDTAKISGAKILESKINRPTDENNQYSDGNDGQLLRSKGDGSTEWSDVGQPTDAQVSQAVTDWLNDHPEATTTVQDGSLTEAKFSAALKLKTIKDYATPEMFGAVGDGVTDDSSAFSQAINAADFIFLTQSYHIENVELKENTVIVGGEIVATPGVPALTFDGTDAVTEYRCKTTIEDVTFKGGSTYIDFSVASNLPYNDVRYMVGCIIRNCKFYGSYTDTPSATPEAYTDVLNRTAAIKAEKFYDAIIEGCNFLNLEIGILFHGCDVCAIQNNRFQKCGYAFANIHITAHEGASNIFQHNDVLSWLYYGAVYLYESRSDTIAYNYFECYTVNACGVYGNKCINTNLIFNRFDDTTQSAPIIHLIPYYGVYIDGINYVRSSTLGLVQIDNDNVPVNNRNQDTSVHLSNIPWDIKVKCNLINGEPFSVKNISGLFGGVLSTSEWPPISGDSFINSANYGEWRINLHKQAYNHKIYLYDKSSTASTVYMVVKDPDGNTLVSGNLTQANPLSFNGIFDYVAVTMKTFSTVGSIVFD